MKISRRLLLSLSLGVVVLNLVDALMTFAELDRSVFVHETNPVMRNLAYGPFGIFVAVKLGIVVLGCAVLVYRGGKLGLWSLVGVLSFYVLVSCWHLIVWSSF